MSRDPIARALASGAGAEAARLSASKASANTKGQTSVKATRWRLPNGINSRQTMASPPTITVATSSGISGGRIVPATTAQDNGNGTTFTTNFASGEFTYSGAGNFSVVGSSLNTAPYVRPSNVSYNDGNNTMNWWRASAIHTGSRIEFRLFGTSQGATAGTKLLFKVDDKYVSLTPTQTGTGAMQYVLLDFGGTVATRRIEIIGKMIFGGAIVDLFDTITPAPVRGPRTIFLGDSFTEGTGATSPGVGTSYPLGYVQVFADAMGWDDVWPSGIGGTGYLNVSGGPRTYRTRLATDVIPYAPEVLFITGGINDFAYTQQQIYDEALLTFNTAKLGLPNTVIYAVSPFLNAGPGGVGTALWRTYMAVKQAAADAGILFLDIDRLPLPKDATINSITTIVGANAGDATIQFSGSSLPVLGGVYATADGTRAIQVRAISGTRPYTVTVDYNATFIAQGTVLTRVGNCYLAGYGRQISFTAALTAATSGTLSSAWNGFTGSYTITFSDGSTRTATLTNGSTSVSWTGAMTAAASASAHFTAGNTALAVSQDGTHPPTFGHQITGEVVASQFIYSLAA